MIALYLVIACVVGYFIGNINFARIFCWIFAHKHITEIGSKNPGTTNVLRTRGFGEAMLTLIFEAAKSGGPALGGYYLFEHFFAGFGNLAFFLIGFFVVIGHCFPVFYHFKAGKGVACTFGIFAFHPMFWWGAIIVFACGFVAYLFIRYAFIVNLLAMIALSIYGTVYFVLTEPYKLFIPLLVIIWVNVALLFFTHRGNLKRFFNGTENKIEFRKYLKSKKKREEEEKLSLELQAQEVPAGACVEASKEEVKTDDEGKTV